jgi:hypothetical protein
MSFRFDEPEQPPAPREPAQPADDPSLVAPAALDPAVRIELDKLPDVEPGYAKYLDGGLSPAMEMRVEIQRDRIQATLPDSPSPHLVRLAWAEVRTNEPQPETHKFTNVLQHEFALAKNIAYAREVDAALARQPEPAPAAPRETPPPAAPAAAPNEPPLASTQPKPQAPSPQTQTPLQVRPLMMDELREKARTIPEVQARVNLQIAALRKRPDMQTAEQRQEAFGRVQAEMSRAAQDGDKVSERKLRIQVLALDELTRETVVAPRPLPVQTEDPTNPNRAMSAAPARFNVSDSPPGPVIETVQAPVVPTVAGPRPLPSNSLEPTNPNLNLSLPAERFVVQSEPSLAPVAKPSALDISTNEGPPIHRRADLGLPPPPPPDLDGPTVTDRSAPEVLDLDGPTVRTPSAPGQLESTLEEQRAPSPDDLQASDERSPPIHKREDLIPREPNALEQEVPDEPPTLAVSEPGTAPGRRGAKVKAARSDATQEVGQDDFIADEVRPVIDTQDHFSTYFDRTINERPLANAIRNDAERYQQAFNNGLAGNERHSALFVAATERAASFKRGDGNAEPNELRRQYQILAEDERLAERTGDAHLVDRLALADLHAQAVHRDNVLAKSIRLTQEAELASLIEVGGITPKDLADLRLEASLLLSTVDSKYGESPYTKSPFLRAELLRSHEDNPEYARVCGVLLRATTTPDEHLMYIAETTPSLLNRATERAASLASADESSTDQALRREIAEGRVDMALAAIANDEPARAQAERRAAEAALVYDKLPMLRTLEDTAPPPSRRGV